jgi:hypothetical protein
VSVYPNQQSAPAGHSKLMDARARGVWSSVIASLLVNAEIMEAELTAFPVTHVEHTYCTKR